MDKSIVSAWLARLAFAALALLVWAGVAMAAPPDYGTDSGDAVEQAPPPDYGTGAGDSAEQAPAASAAAPASHHLKTFPYTIRPGDSFGKIAAEFGIDADDLAAANHMSVDDDLMAGAVLKIPNPFEAREHALNDEVSGLSQQVELANQRADKATSEVQSLRPQVDQLDASNREYLHSLKTLPWWRAAAFTTAAAAAILLGVVLLAVYEWWALRSRFRAVAEMNDSLRRLDSRYRSVLAKAELRLQELYGRRRKGLQDGQERLRIPEEAEIERLNHQLKDMLEREVARLGPPNEKVRRRARWRELIGSVGAPVEARSARR